MILMMSALMTCTYCGCFKWVFHFENFKVFQILGQQNHPNVGGTYQGNYGRGGGQQNNRGGSVNYQRGGGGHRGGMVGKPQSKEKLKFESDYDFEKANEQFQETLNHISLDLKMTKLEG